MLSSSFFKKGNNISVEQNNFFKEKCRLIIRDFPDWLKDTKEKFNQVNKQYQKDFEREIFNSTMESLYKYYFICKGKTNIIGLSMDDLVMPPLELLNERFKKCCDDYSKLEKQIKFQKGIILSKIIELNKMEFPEKEKYSKNLVKILQSLNGLLTSCSKIVPILESQKQTLLKLNVEVESYFKQPISVGEQIACKLLCDIHQGNIEDYSPYQTAINKAAEIINRDEECSMTEITQLLKEAYDSYHTSLKLSR